MNLPNTEIKIDERNADFVVEMNEEGVLKGAGVKTGDILFIKKTKKIADGDIIALRLSEGIVLYKYILGENDIVLSLENEDLPSIPCTYEQFSQMVVVGKVVLLMRNM